MTPALPDLNALVRLAYGSTILPSRVENVEGSRLLLAAPEGVVEPPDGTVMVLHWASVRGASEVPVTFTGVAHDRVPLWQVDVAGAADLVQRREYARARADQARAALVPLRATIAPVRTGWVLDISEGGARCAFPTGQVQADEEVELHLDLGGISVVAVGTVLRVLPTFDGNEEIVVEYEVSERVADRIRAYVFSRQRRQRRPVRR